ncbi:hypothetical protein [Methylobacterium sp. J-090]|uniref:hypothetical protein n=1 Tax=Methylobacterium sp. J-090 TaxID=2836666 RepID=UPI001FBB1AF1|nr:hypothetical protein [Methylobacterium sp. J-090]MCJ2082165.1 hypothetical protein [Methylobacterium sp. J-090]
MEEIASHLGHSNPKVTRELYALFSPEALTRRAGALELDDLGLKEVPAVGRSIEPAKSAKRTQVRFAEPEGTFEKCPAIRIRRGETIVPAREKWWALQGSNL